MTQTNDNNAAQVKIGRKRKRSGTPGVELVLKISSDESQSANTHRSKKREDAEAPPDSNAPIKHQADEKMERRLSSVKKLLETLPQYVNDEGKDLVANVLSLKIELKHMENKTRLYDTNKVFYPETCKIGFTLICQKEY